MTVLPGTDSANLDPATAALLQLLAVSGTENFSDEQFDTHDMDWQAVLAAARRRGLELLLYDRLRAEAWKDRLPPEVKYSLRERYLAAAARNMRVLHHAAEILKALKAAGIEVIVLKGLYLVENIYASIGLRIFGDIDLLLRKGKPGGRADSDAGAGVCAFHLVRPGRTQHGYQAPAAAAERQSANHRAALDHPGGGRTLQH